MYKIYDISQELINSNIYPGNIKPKLELIKDMNQNDSYNLSNITMCVHNGTHIDAPLHFISGGKSVDKIDLDKFIGRCYVKTFQKNIIAQDIKELLQYIYNNYHESIKKIIIKGSGIVTPSAAITLAESNIELIGTELPLVGDPCAPMEVHKILLNQEIILLEGLMLKDIVDGDYFLCAAPINIKNSEGAPTRAFPIKF